MVGIFLKLGNFEKKCLGNLKKAWEFVWQNSWEISKKILGIFDKIVGRSQKKSWEFLKIVGRSQKNLGILKIGWEISKTNLGMLQSVWEISKILGNFEN